MPPPDKSPEPRNRKKKANIEKAVKKLVKQYFAVADADDSGTLHQDLTHRVERALIKNVLKKTQHNQSQTAKILGISRTTLRKKIADFHLQPPPEPQPDESEKLSDEGRCD